MALTREQAKAKALAAGVPEEAVNDAILDYYGFDLAEQIAQVVERPEKPVAVKEAEFKAALQALSAEAKANNVPAQIFNAIDKVVEKGLDLIL